MPTSDAIAIVGDDAEDRHGDPLEPGRLEAIARLLDAAYPVGRLAGFTMSGSGFTAVLSAEADPLLAVLLVGLLDDAPRVRWSIAVTGPSGVRRGDDSFVGAGGAVVGAVGAAAGPAVGAAGPAVGAVDAALDRARDALDRARVRRDHLVVRTGEPCADRLLDAIAPLLAGLLEDLTDRQRSVARMLLLDGLRQADVAEALGVSRATVSVMAGRGRVRSIERLAGAIRVVTAAGRQARTSVPVGPAPARPRLSRFSHR